MPGATEAAGSIARVTKERIIAEIRRTAEANGGSPLGRGRFQETTGIRESDWYGRYWLRWSDAVEEAGFAANTFNQRYDDDEVLARLAVEIRRLGRMPVRSEMLMAHREDAGFPSANVFLRFGSKQELAIKMLDYCRAQEGYDDVAALLEPLEETDRPSEQPDAVEAAAEVVDGFVYLLKSGRHYKIGWTRDMGRRRYELKIQLPEPATEVHVITTDDPIGIERYWHARFDSSRTNGEWFSLSKADVAAFRRRRFM